MRLQPVRRPKDAEQSPFLVIWETTQACDLACQHCRANAVTQPHPLSLTTSQAEKLLDDVASFSKPHPLMVFTGGDPFKRDDLAHLVRYARELGLHCGVSPSATPLLTQASLARVAEAGAQVVSLSLDGSYESLHDDFRGVGGSFTRTLQACTWAREAGMKLQINTTLSRHNLHDLVDLAVLVRSFEVMTWSVFLLVPTGRGENLDSLTADELEAVMHFLAEVSECIPLKTTEGHHYKRVLAMRQVLRELDHSPDEGLELPPLYRELKGQWEARRVDLGIAPRTAARRTPMHINSGHGFVFVSHLGHVCPSGFLPISAGNVKDLSLVEIYRDSPLFQDLRQPSKLTGRCGACEFRELCGGSRSRAFAVHQDAFSEDPSCNYQPGSFLYQDRLAEILGLAKVRA